MQLELIFRKVTSIYSREHYRWPLIQQVLTRILVGGKFFLIARIAGPEEMGFLIVALAIYAFVDSFSDIGLSQAIVQIKDEPDQKQMATLWSIGLIRGAVLFAGLMFVSFSFFGQPSQAKLQSLLICCSALFVTRSLANLYYVVLARSLRFKLTASVELGANSFDFLVAGVAALSGIGALAFIIGLLAADILRVAVSWIAVARRVSPTSRFTGVRLLLNQGFWIWASGVLISLTLQSDKWVLGSLSTAVEVGNYQTSLRLVQLPTQDLMSALAMSLFPMLASKYHSSPVDAYRYFCQIRLKMLVVVLISGSAMAIFGPKLAGSLLGNEWNNLGVSIYVCVPQCLVGTWCYLEVTLARATGVSFKILPAVAGQLIVFFLLGYPLYHLLGTIGINISMTAGGILAAAILMRTTRVTASARNEPIEVTL